MPPQALEAEESVLCSIILDNSDLQTIKEILEPDDFYRTSHREIFTAILELADKGDPIDLVTLTNHLRSKDLLEKIGGAHYLAQLTREAPATNPIAHAKIVKEKAIRRQVLQEANNLARMAFDDMVTIDKISAKIMEISSGVIKQSAKESGIKKLEMTVENLQNYFSSLRETPFEWLNNAIEGLMFGELTIVASRPGMGKTAFVLELASHTAIDENVPVIYCGAQMSKTRIYARLLAQRCRISLRKILGGKVSDTVAMEKLSQSHQKINSAPIYDFIIRDRISVLELKTMVIGAQDRIGQSPGLLIVENLQQLFYPGKRENEQINFICEVLKSFSYEIKAPIVLSSQLNRDIEDREDKRPMPSDIFGKKAEELGDLIIFPFRPNYYEKKEIKEKGRPERDAELLISKGGPPISIPFTFWGDYLSWQEK
ncbi:MAG: DnaB-like helicase C-terminal domain-containing protein [Candidatus Giovannonibacteria bacterium]|nr:DnaB-like helicase C-terminal domain-containing protein [Candidatus Giovannonibacteria bacterium]